jgi:hypothetical protein
MNELEGNLVPYFISLEIMINSTLSLRGKEMVGHPNWHIYRALVTWTKGQKPNKS